MTKQLISIVIPCFEEAPNIGPLHKKINSAIDNLSFDVEIIFVDDGSSDDTVKKIKLAAKSDKRIRLIEFSRNFGKEAATTAGINRARGNAIIIMDSDGQHPAELIPEFIKKWEAGSHVVVGVRSSSKHESFVKKYGSRIFYRLINIFSGMNIIPGSTDFRLIDSTVQREFNKLNEKSRITRGLIDWLGFDRDYVYFHAHERMHGEAGYTFHKLVVLALNSFVSLSFMPLFIMGYLGVLISLIAGITGIFAVIEGLLLNDPLGLNITGSGYLGLLILFLVGFILISQGLMSLYISRIYQEVQNRPLYVIK